MASLAAEGQHKVSMKLSYFKYSSDLGVSQLLAANLEEADPVVYEILQRVRLSRYEMDNWVELNRSV